jgi:energy-coupling factor transport system permease protein
MDMRGYRSRQSVEKNKLSWNKTDVAALSCVVVMGLGVVLGGLM